MRLLKKICQEYQKRSVNTTYFVSFPKSGRTWVRQFLNQYFFYKFPFSVTDRLGKVYYDKIPNIKFTHYGYDIMSSNDIQRLIKKYIRNKLINSRIIFLIRDPRDVVVSYFFQLIKRKDLARNKSSRDWDSVKIDDLVYDKNYGIEPIIAYMNLWHQELKNSKKTFHLVTYENIMLKPELEFKSILRFIKNEEINEQALEEAINETTFSSMKKKEQIGLHSQEQLNTTCTHDNDSYKVRKGKVGNFVDYFDTKEIIYMKEAMKKLDSELFDFFKL